MPDTKTEAVEKTGSKDAATTPATTPGSRPAGIAPSQTVRVPIGSEANPLSKAQRKHLRRQKEAGKIKVTDRRSQISR